MDEFNQGPEEKVEDKKKEYLAKIKEFFRKLFDKDGFYVIIFICICIVATTAVWVSTNNLEKINSVDDSENLDLVETPSIIDLSDFDIDDTSPKVVDDAIDEPSVDVGKIDNEVKEEVKNSSEGESDVVQGVEEPASSGESSDGALVSSSNEDTSKEANASIVMITPATGTISKEFAMDSLVYSKTLEQWTTHEGIDISAKESSIVKAALDGVVSSLEEDPTMGIVITIDHGNGLMTKYASLSTTEMVEVGKEVKKGDPISGVGKGVGFELAQGPHLHFEVIKDGENVNPKLYLPEVGQ